jgi:cation diffusion facilitator CzcD-associated flavoprotein CzcO
MASTGLQDLTAFAPPFKEAASPGPLPAPHGLAAHEAAVRRDLDSLRLPAPRWTTPPEGPDGGRMLDVIVVGSGMYGIAAAAALIFKGIRDIAVLDKAPAGQEGPWRDFARMPTLRSPKDLPGAAIGIPSLTFRQWYEASFGTEAWARLYKIPNGIWVDYLSWLKGILELPVENDCPVIHLAPHAGHVTAALADGRLLHARRVVVATGRSGTGGVRIPAEIKQGLWPDLAAHTNEDIDFLRLAGKHVAVLGAGSSAWDNAATALERGAARVTMYVRRPYLPQINKGRASASPGFMEGWGALVPADKWSLLVYLDDIQAPPAHEAVLRTMKHPNFQLKLGARVLSATPVKKQVALDLPAGRDMADFLIVGTGFAVEMEKDPLMSSIMRDAARWQDHYQPPATERRPHLALYPWLSPGFELQPRGDASPPGLERLHLFNHAAIASLGHIASDVPGLTVGAQRLSSAIAAHLFREDLSGIRKAMEDWDEHELEPTALHVRVHPGTMERLA